MLLFSLPPGDTVLRLIFPVTPGQYILELADALSLKNFAPAIP